MIDVHQLAALRRQTGALAPKRPANTDRLLVQVASLRRLLRVKSQVQPKVAAHQDRTIPGTQIAPGLWCDETRITMPELAQATLVGDFDRRTDVPTKDLLFFDTETTGLAGGTGTRAFMIGASDVVGDVLRIRQLTIATLAAETAMLRLFATWLAPTTILVSYNGKSYDAPLLKTRYRMMCMPEPISCLEHVDLLYPTRRRYRGVHENCRLATIERRVLGIVREDDLPGSEAPGAWLGYLRGGSASLLRRVTAHNHQDVVTLAHLALHMHALAVSSEACSERHPSSVCSNPENQSA